MEVPAVLHWFGQNPFGAASVVYVAAIVGVFVYTYIEHLRED
jgi:hypothetical protein